MNKTCELKSNTIKMENEEFLIEALRQVISQVDAFIVPNRSARLENLSNLMYLRSLLKDDYSRDEYDKLLIKLFAIDFMEKKRACHRFKVHEDTYWEKIQQLEKIIIIPEMENYGDWGDKVIFRESFAMDPYSYKDICTVEPGDVVLDCGAYVGDTAYVFNERLGGDGLVFAFEPLPENYEKLKNNIERMDYQDKIIPLNVGVSDKESTLSFACNQNNHGASRIAPDGKIKVDVITIDSFVESESRISNVNFIKMDIEGAEVSAIKGAENVIRRFRPKMAICIYHKVEDHWQIPRLILSIDNRYEFYLRHHTENNTETVLFCVPVDYNPCVPDEKKYNNQMINGIQELYLTTHGKLRANAKWSEKKYKELETSMISKTFEKQNKLGRIASCFTKICKKTGS